MKATIDTAKAWYVVRTNIKCEEKAVANIRAAGFDAYLPRQRYEYKHKRNNTYVVRERPLMLRYLFVGFDKRNKAFGFVRSCEGVESFIECQGWPIPVSEKDVASIYDAEMNMDFDDTKAARIHRREEAKTKKLTLEMKWPAGLHVRVNDGPFKSFMGEVESITNRGHIQVLVGIFGRKVSVEMEAPQIEAA
jgi:transcriptional antiterminator NusG